MAACMAPSWHTAVKLLSLNADLAGCLRCPNAPELYYLGWAQPVLTLTRYDLLPGQPVRLTVRWRSASRSWTVAGGL